LAIGIPILFNTIAVVAIYTLLTAQLRAGFDTVNQRFNDMRDVWRAELSRVEDVLDARLKLFEERRS